MSHSWEIIEGRYLQCLLLEYLATIGMVDVAFIPPEHARPDFRNAARTMGYGLK